MEINLFQHIVELAPGVVGVAVAKLFHGDSTKENINDALFKYLLYAAGAWSLTKAVELVLFLLGIDLCREGFIAVSLVMAALLGFAWCVFLENYLVKLTNKIRTICGKNPIFLNEAIFGQITNDGKHHYLVVFKNNEIIAQGFLEYSYIPDKSFTLIQSPEWEEYFRGNNKHTRSLIYLGQDLHIVEYSLEEF